VSDDFQLSDCERDKLLSFIEESVRIFTDGSFRRKEGVGKTQIQAAGFWYDCPPRDMYRNAQQRLSARDQIRVRASFARTTFTEDRDSLLFVRSGNR